MDLGERKMSNREKRKSKLFHESMVLDILCAEKDIFQSYRDEYKLYVKDNNGKFIQVAEYFHPDINKVIMEIFRKQKLRFSLLFMDSIPTILEMKPYTLRILLFFVETMRRNNEVPFSSLSYINEHTSVSQRYITKGINQLLEMDVVRREKNKNSFTYMVNPGFFCKATLRSVAVTVTEKYSQMKPHLKKDYDFLNFEMD